MNKIIGLGVHGTVVSAKSHFQIQILKGLVYLEIVDGDTGTNTRIAKISLSPDKMRLIGEALVALGDGADLQDVDRGGFNRVTSITS